MGSPLSEVFPTSDIMPKRWLFQVLLLGSLVVVQNLISVSFGDLSAVDLVLLPMLLVILVYLVAQWRGRAHFIRVTQHSVEMDGWRQHMTLPLADLTDVRIKRMSEFAFPIRALLWLLGLYIDRPFVELRFKRFLRVSWLTGRYGTRVTGMPFPLLPKRLRMVPENPEAFSASVRAHSG